MIAKKLELPIFEDWIKHEQNGYGEYEIPEYRRVRGQVKGLNNRGRWIPVIFSSVAAEERFTTVRLPFSISQLLDLYKVQTQFHGAEVWNLKEIRKLL